MDAGQMNYVGLLHELASRKGWSVDFQEATAGPDHIKKFTSKAVVNGMVYPEGSGQKKKEAKQDAAKHALEKLENDESVNTETSLPSSASLSLVTQANFICWLNEYSHKTKLAFIPTETTKMCPGSNIQLCLYACKYVCGDREFPEATGNSKKEAKEAAAKLVHEILTKQVDENANGEENPNIQNLSLHRQQLSTTTDMESTSSGMNYIGRLNEYCQRFKQVCDFKPVEKKGPAHVPEFVYRVVISKNEYPEGHGRTVKEAKQKAAQLAWSELSLGLSSQNSSLSSMSESQVSVTVSASMSPPSSFVPETPVKQKRQLAANFQNSPVNNKKSPTASSPSTKSPTASSPSTKSRFLEEFDTICRVGKGGFGSVFKARRKLEDTFFAVKIVKFNEKARREVNALSRLVHVNIVRYHTSWTEATKYRDETSDTSSDSLPDSGSKYLYIQMEFCDGETLRKWIDERNDHPEKYPNRRQEATDIIKQVLEAVKHIHANQCFHRDLKPLNIMFGHEGRVKVGDFGLVSREEKDEDGHLLERTQQTGTFSYMSPELRQHQKDYGRKVDIYAVGLIFFELLWRFGTMAERGEQWDNIRSKNFPEEFSKTFDFEHKNIKKMLSENPVERPEASNLLIKLDQLSATTASTKYNVHKENRTY
ncbi:interferon-induced, double-stranded RNA-activated protein kinase [Hemibagrus wyckioides]|uniref:interferon-induced, double-stranded RNA-activated protein kinase n=1 Tax=Hemibagrus wyckioides TaxID=337641 RepID=UPI00266C81D6|nr:interferon-induced, double-stranded RNA-activated protein kinase [Hemibagrus wyckioides]